MTTTEEHELPDIIPEIDKTSPYTLLVTMCTGRHEVDHPVNRVVAHERYLRQLRLALREDEEHIYADAHIARIDLICRNLEGEIASVMSTLHDIPSCEHKKEEV